MTLLTSLLTATNFRNPFLRTIVPSIGLAYGLQAAVAIPSILAQSERFYDASGSLTYIACTALSLYLPALRARSAAAITGAPKPAWPSLIDAIQGKGGPLGLNWRQAFLSAAVSIWAARRMTSLTRLTDELTNIVGTFLFARILSDGEDSRFKNIRNSPPKFAVAFFAQATWVSLCLLPVMAVNSLPASTFAALGGIVSITDILGILLYVGGLSFEATADRQKNKWVQEKKEKKHEEDFLTRGLW